MRRLLTPRFVVLPEQEQVSHLPHVTEASFTGAAGRQAWRDKLCIYQPIASLGVPTR